MKLAKYFVGIYLIFLSAVVAINWVATPLYHEGGTSYPVWEIINWFMLAAIILALMLNTCKKFCSDRTQTEEVTRSYLEANVLFYATAFLALLFFGSWLSTFNPQGEADAVNSIHLSFWTWVDSLFVLIMFASGRAALRGSK